MEEGEGGGKEVSEKPPPTPKQHGGPITRGDAYVVGETGPELFIPNTSGRIVPNNQMAQPGAIGGGDINYIFENTIFVDGGNPAEILALFQRQARQASVAGAGYAGS